MASPQYGSTLELPVGIPSLTGHFGIARHAKGSQPALLLNHDWDLLFVEQGKAEWKFTNRPVVETKAGDFLLLPPFTPAVPKTLQSGLRLWFCHFDFKPLPRRIFPSVRWDCLERGRTIWIPQIFTKQDAPKVWRAYHPFISTKLNPKAAPWSYECALLQMVSKLAEFALKLNIPGPENSPAPAVYQDPRVINLCGEIQENPAFPWRVHTLAKNLQLSPRHLDRLCRLTLGKNLKHYLVESRLHLAIKHLKETRDRRPFLSIKEISAMTGFSSQQFFSSQFKKFYGISPLKYREALLGDSFA
jgi:AraC-like DNA-binding protein